VIARTPEPPYFAVIFTSQRAVGDDAAYEAAARRMLDLAVQRYGCLGVESVRDVRGRGITVSYWPSLEAIAAWRGDTEHRAAQRMGRSAWYAGYRVRVCRVEREAGSGERARASDER